MEHVSRRASAQSQCAFRNASVCVELPSLTALNLANTGVKIFCVEPLLTPLSGDIEDSMVLTPAHFISGFPLNAPPEPLRDVEEDLDRLSHWRLVQAIFAINCGLAGRGSTYMRFHSDRSG